MSLLATFGTSDGSGHYTLPTWIDGLFFHLHWSDIDYSISSGHYVFNDAVGTPPCGMLGANVPTNPQAIFDLLTPGSAPPKLSFGIEAGVSTPTASSSMNTNAPVVMVGPLETPVTDQVRSGYFYASQPAGDSTDCDQLPITWDTEGSSNAFATEYDAVVSDFVSYLASSGVGRWRDVRIIKILGINEHTIEIGMNTSDTAAAVPGTPCAAGAAYTYTTVTGQTVHPASDPPQEIWQKEGFYTSGVSNADATVGTVWNNIVSGIISIPMVNTALMGANPTIILSTSVINSNSFPFSGSGQQAQDQEYMEGLIGRLLMSPVNLPANEVAVQFDALGECEPEPLDSPPTSEAYNYCPDNSGPDYHYQIVCNENTSAGTLIGWQTNNYGNSNNNPASTCGAENDKTAACQPPARYKAMLDNGIGNGATFLEVWSTDAANAQYHPNQTFPAVQTSLQQTPYYTMCRVANGGSD